MRAVERTRFRNPPSCGFAIERIVLVCTVPLLIQAIVDPTVSANKMMAFYPSAVHTSTADAITCCFARPGQAGGSRTAP